MLRCFFIYFTEQPETIGSSVDPPEVEPMEIEQATDGKGDASFSPTSPDFKMEPKDNTIVGSEVS